MYFSLEDYHSWIFKLFIADFIIIIEECQFGENKHLQFLLVICARLTYNRSPCESIFHKFDGVKIQFFDHQKTLQPIKKFQESKKHIAMALNIIERKKTMVAKASYWEVVDMAKSMSKYNYHSIFTSCYCKICHCYANENSLLHVIGIAQCIDRIQCLFPTQGLLRVLPLSY